MEIKLSIIVPVYNIEKYIEKAVESLINQCVYSYEVILVNDGSTDDSGRICSEYEDKYPKTIRVIHKENGGLPSARKAGVDVARGKYISFLDGDDWCGKSYYYNMLRSAEEEEAEIVCSNYTYAYTNENVICKNLINSGVYCSEELDKLKRNILYTEPYYTFGIHPSLCMKIVRADVLKKYIYMVPNTVALAEDAACTYPMLFAAKKVVVLNENVEYYYRQVESSMTHAYSPSKINRICAVMDFMDNIFKPYHQLYEYQINMYYTQLIKEGIGNEIKSKQPLRNKSEKLDILLNKPYVKRTLKNMKGVPVVYRIYFRLFEKRMYGILTFLIRFRK